MLPSSFQTLAIKRDPECVNKEQKTGLHVKKKKGSEIRVLVDFSLVMHRKLENNKAIPLKF